MILRFGNVWTPAAMALCAFSGAVVAAELPSYEATYEIRLTHASATTGPRAATGTFNSRFAETCDGWETRSHVVMDLAFRDGAAYTNERFFTSWESKAGLDYRFAVETTKNGAVVEAFKGTAKLNKKGGQAIYEIPTAAGAKPAPKVTIDLPRDTLLPVAHSRALLARAGGGEALFRSVVLNGGSSTGPRLMSVAIGPRVAGGDKAGTADIDPTLLGAPSWRMSSAIFNLNENRDTPNFEMLLQLHETGVTQSFEQTFTDFAVSATLKKLRRLDAPDCSRG